MSRSRMLAVSMLAALALPAATVAKERWAADSAAGDQAIAVPCPDGSTATVTLRALQVQYDKSFKVPLEQPQYVRASVFGATGGCATEMVFEVVTPPKVEDDGDFDHTSCTSGNGVKRCPIEFADGRGPHGGDVLDAYTGPPVEEQPGRRSVVTPSKLNYFAVPQGDGSRPFRLQVPMIPKKAYKTFGKPEGTTGRPQIYVYVRAKGTTGLGVPASTSVGLWTASGCACETATIPKRISRSALASGKARIAVLGPEDTDASVVVKAGKTVVASGKGRVPASGRLKIRLHPKAAIPLSARKVLVSATIGNSGVSGPSRLES